MSTLFEKMIDKVSRIDQLVSMQATGTPEEFARRLNISPSTLYLYILVMRRALQAPIQYCKMRKSYYYTESGRVNIGFRKKENVV